MGFCNFLYTMMSLWRIDLVTFSSGHPWLVGSHELKIPTDMIIYKLVKVYIMSTSLRKSALAVSLILQKLWHIQLSWQISVVELNGFLFMVPGSCQDINRAAVSLSEGAIYVVGAKQEWIYLHAELQNSEWYVSMIQSTCFLFICGFLWFLIFFSCKCQAILKSATDATKDSRVLDFVHMVWNKNGVRFIITSLGFVAKAF